MDPGPGSTDGGVLSLWHTPLSCRNPSVGLGLYTWIGGARLGCHSHAIWALCPPCANQKRLMLIQLGLSKPVSKGIREHQCFGVIPTPVGCESQCAVTIYPHGLSCFSSAAGWGAKPTTPLAMWCGRGRQQQLIPYHLNQSFRRALAAQGSMGVVVFIDIYRMNGYFFISKTEGDLQ